jgi:hypothetical protein
MQDTERYRLVHAPYAAPCCRIGDQLSCEIRGWVTVRCMSDGLIPWPMTKVRGNRAFILCGDLARAAQQEAAIAVCHWWGVTPQTVTKWRAVLDVPEYSEATRRLHREWMPERVPPEVHARAIAAANTPEANAKKAAAKIGHALSEKTAAALARGREKLREGADGT